MSALGPLRSAAYLAVKRSEVEHFRARDTAYECRQHWLTF
jgi:glutamine synthetase